MTREEINIDTHVYKIQKKNIEYLKRYYIVPRNRLLNVYIHKFENSDDLRALHDHPWDSVSLLLTNGYTEWVPRNHTAWTLNEERTIKPLDRPQFSIIYRPKETIHAIELNNGPVWTLFLTGPWAREWGFWCHNRFVTHVEYHSDNCD